jgi:WD40 repeat protein/serine/threonine protein kinase
MNEREIFDAALAIPDQAQRSAYLVDVCAGQNDLREHIEELLEMHGQLGNFLEWPAPSQATTAEEPFSERPGAAIGPYKLLQQLGEGGMGTVFLAEQQEPVRRQVAFKIIKAGMDSAHVIARFEQERQALAIMDHPNIAKVLDAGTTPAGRPYFVMDLVKGVPITKYCDQEHLTPRERLELFIPVCQAVQHAHQKGIIHRDLKPSNVLIALYDGKPIPKVIDFGVAKATSQKLTERTMFTEVGQMVGTLEYMAPEQAELNNLDIDTRADIYALGVMLYELLTGSPPFTSKQLRSVAFEEMLRIIREVEPAKPSTKLSSSDQLPSIAANRKLEPAKLARLVCGDLDWIVMKALEKDRSRRYETANGLALEIQRYLHNEPVLARPPSPGYRLRKFVRRHPAPTALAVVSIVAALSVVGFVVGQFYNARLAAINSKLRDTSNNLEVANAQLEDSSDQLKRALLAAESEQTRARRYLYVSQMTLAERARQEGEIGRVMQLLRGLIPKSSGEEDLRGFEWYQLWRQYHGEKSCLRGHKEAVSAVAFSPDDRILASGSADRTVKLWDTKTGKEVLALKGHEDSVTSLAFSPDGKRLVSGSADKTVKIWDAATGRTIHTLEGHAESVTAVAYSSDGRHVVSGSVDKTVWVWDVEAGRMTAQYRKHEQPVNGVAFSPDGKTVVSVSGLLSPRLKPPNGEAVLWSASTGEEIMRLDGSGNLTSVAFSPDGKQLAVGEFIGVGTTKPATVVLKLWDLNSPKSPRSLQGHTGLITTLVFSRNGKDLASASLDHTVKIWDVAGMKEKSVLHEEAGVLTVAISPNGQRIAAGGEDRTVKLWAPPSCEVLSFSAGGAAINNVVFSPDGRQVAAASGAEQMKRPGGAVTVWDAGSGAELRKFSAGQYLRVAWSPEGRSLGVDSTGKFVDPLTGESGRALPVSPDLYGAAFSQDGKLFATATGSTVCVWDRHTGACLNKFVVASFASCVAFSPDGNWLASGSGEQSRAYRAGALNVWDLKTGKPVSFFHTIPISTWGVVFSPDGKRLAAATGFYGSWEPGNVRVWDTTSWNELYLLQGHGNCVWSLAFSPDGRRLVSAAGSFMRQRGEVKTPPGEVKIWDMDTGQELWTLRGHAQTVFGAVFSPCGRYLATGGADGTVKIWDGTPLAETPKREATAVD